VVVLSKKQVYILRRLKEDDDDNMCTFREVHQSIVTRIEEVAKFGYAELCKETWHITDLGRKALGSFEERKIGMQKALDRLKELFLLDENEVDYIKKSWLYNEAAQGSSMSYGTTLDVSEAFEKLDEERKQYITEILMTYPGEFCPTCDRLLIFNADIDAVYYCEVCKLGVSWDLKMVKVDYE